MKSNDGGKLLFLDPAIEAIKASGVASSETLCELLTEYIDGLADDGDDPEDPYSQARIYEGDLDLPSDLEISASPMVVLGNLTVDGQVTDLIQADQSLLMVAGDLKCKSIWQLGSMFIAGSVTTPVFYAASFYDNWTHKAGDVNAEVIIENHHSFRIDGQLTCKARLGDRFEVGGQDIGESKEVVKLHPVLFGGDDPFDEEALYQHICAGRPLLLR